MELGDGNTKYCMTIYALTYVDQLHPYSLWSLDFAIGSFPDIYIYIYVFHSRIKIRQQELRKRPEPIVLTQQVIVATCFEKNRTSVSDMTRIESSHR